MNLRNDPIIKEILIRLDKLEEKLSNEDIRPRVSRAKTVTLAELARRGMLKK